MKTNYKLTGTPNSPTLILSHSLGATYHMWDGLVPYLTPYFRVLQYDTRGHGESEKPNGPYTIEELGRDVVALMDSLEIDQAYYCGVSMGGLIGQWLGIHAPGRFYKMALSNTGAKIGSMESWQERSDILRKNGMKAIVDSTMEKWFTHAFRSAHPVAHSDFESMFTANDVSGYCHCCQAIGKADFTTEIKQLKLKTLVITGDQDAVTNVDHAQFLVDHIPDAELMILPGKHLVNVEAPAPYADCLIDFFIGKDVYSRGMHVRKTVLGEDHVARSQKNINVFNADFQEFITQVPWGQVWTRPGLSKHQRSLITLAMLIALNRTEELRMHVRGAINNGVTPTEIKELILHASIYAGFPCALEGYKHAEEVLKEHGLI